MKATNYFEQAMGKEEGDKVFQWWKKQTESYDMKIQNKKEKERQKGRKKREKKMFGRSPHQ
jgi:hypothetical protein